MVAIDAPSFTDGLEQPSVRPYAGVDHQWAQSLLECTGGRHRVRRGLVVDTAVLPGFIGSRNGVDSTLVTFSRHPKQFELSVVASSPFDDEVVSVTIAAALAQRAADCQRAFAICSNAQFDVQRALQSFGFRLCSARPGSVEAVARRTATPLTTSFDQLAVRDEVEFDLLFR